ncbi:hypothetical protein ABW19_dt0200265 [Dactylella cylindrospora]|nr:hypothetical protein ABW19_dt0200265 [Dactylella cylindrospora]
MSSLFIRKSSLWPRYHLRVAQSLEIQKAEVIELEVSMTPAMQAIQNAALQCIEISISELRKSNIGLEIDDWSVDSALHRSFDAIIRRQLDPVWHRVSSKTRQIANDLTTLRTILTNLLSLDSVSFHQYLETVVAANAPSGTSVWQNQSPWLFLDAAETLFSTARKRVYTGELSRGPTFQTANHINLVLEEHPKWQVLSGVLDEIAINGKVGSRLSQPGATLIMCPDRHSCSQVAEYLQTARNTDEDIWNGGLESQGPASNIMYRKFLAFVAWRSDFVRFQASKTYRDQQKPTGELSNSSSGRKAPANKRRRVRGGSQFAAGNRSQGVASDSKKGTDFVNHPVHPLGPMERESLYLEELVGPPNFIETDFLMHEPKDVIVIHPYDALSDSTLLEELQPQSIIMYSPEPAFIRRVEVYRSSHSIVDVKVYFMYYGGSVEEQTYLSRVRREKDSFTKLIRQKANMSMTLSNDSRLIGDQQEQFLRTINTRIAGGGRLIASAEPPRVVIDFREFRSSLPSLLHGKGATIVPCTLTVGDYVLSPSICVERKSIKDLISSFKDGRLYTQVEAMLANYKEPMLLIEFDQDKSFNLEPFIDVTAKSSALPNDLQSKLVLLTLHFPRLRIIWSSGSYQTAEIFEELKRGQLEPDPIRAVSIGLSSEVDEFNLYAPTPLDMLKSIPGINEKNLKGLIFEISNLLELSNRDEVALAAHLGREVAGQVYRFFNKNIYNEG